MADWGSTYATFLATSYQYWPNRKTVRLQSAGGGSSSVPNARSFSLSESNLPAQMQGKSIKGAMRWIFHATQLATGIRPKLMDVITDTDGLTYTVQTVEENSYGTCYDITALNLKYAFGFTNTLSIRRPAATKSGGVKTATTFTVIASGIEGLVIPTGKQVEEKNGRRTKTGQFDIHMVSQYEWRPDDQIQDETGQIYQILSSGVPGTIDNYLIYAAEVVN
jgi:hypothetical protein